MSDEFTFLGGGSSGSDPTKVDRYTTQTKTASFTAQPWFSYLVDSTSGPVTVTLPAASAGGQFAVKWSAGSSAVTLQRAGSDTIGASATSAVMGLALEVWEFLSDGAAAWNLIGGNKTLSSLDARFEQRYTTQPKTASFTAVAEFAHMVDSTSGAVVATLPAANVAGQRVVIKWDAGANTVTVQRAGSDTIGVAGTTTVVGLLGESVELVSSGAGVWNPTAGIRTLASLDGRYLPPAIPSDHGYLAWNMPVDVAVAAASIAVGGRIEYSLLRRVPVGTITSLVTLCSTVGATLTAGQCFAALWTPSGTLLGQTVDQAAAWVSTGEKVMNLAAPYANTVVQDLIIGFWYNGSTGPTFARSNPVGAAIVTNAGLSGNSLAAGFANTGVTTTAPALGARTGTGTHYFVAVK